MRDPIGAKPMRRKTRRRLWVVMTLMFVVAGIDVGDARPAVAATGSVTYTYDALGRVASVVYDTGVIVFYTYDANGNRLSQVVNLNSATLVWTSTVSPCIANCWGAALW